MLKCSVKRNKDTGKIEKLLGAELNAIASNISFQGINHPAFARAKYFAERNGRDITDVNELAIAQYSINQHTDSNFDAILESATLDYLDQLGDVETQAEEIVEIKITEKNAINRSIRAVDETLLDPTLPSARRAKLLKRKKDLERRLLEAELVQKNSFNLSTLNNVGTHYLGHSWSPGVDAYSGELGRIRDLINKPELLNEEISEIKPVLARLTTVNQLDDLKGHFFIRPDQEITDEIRDTMSAMSNIANKLLQDLLEHQYRNLSKIAYRYEGKKLTREEADRVITDLTGLAANVRGLNQIDERFTNLLSTIMNDVIYKLNDEIYRENQEVDRLMDEAAPFMTDDEMFIQKYKDNKRTGRLIHHYTAEFQEELDDLQNTHMGIDDNEQYISSFEEIEDLQEREAAGEKVAWDKLDKYRNFVEDETVYLDATIINNLVEAKIKGEDMTAPAAAVEAHIQEFAEFADLTDVREAADRMFNLLESANLNLEALEAEYNEIIENYKDRDPSDPKVQEIVQEYIKSRNKIIEDSPMGFALFMKGTERPVQGGNKGGVFRGAKSFRFFVPKKKEHYDPRFNQIKENEALYNAWKYMIRQAKHAQSYAFARERALIKDNWLPYVTSNIIDNMANVPAIAQAIYDDLRNTVVKIDTDEEMFIDRATGKPLKRVNKVSLRMSESSINREVRNRIIDGDTRSKAEIRRDVIDENAREQSWNLRELMKLQNFNHISYKHRLRAQDAVQLVKSMSDRRSSFSQNTFGNPLRKKKVVQATGIGIIDEAMGLIRRSRSNPKDNPEDFIAVDGVPNYSRLQEHYLDVTLYGINTQQHAGRLKEWYTDNAKKAQAFLDMYGFDYEMSDQEITDRLAELHEEREVAKAEGKELDKLLPKNIFIDDIYDLLKVANHKEIITASSAVDGVMKYTQIKGMAYNAFSGMATILYGHIANTIEAGRWYSEDSLDRARKISFRAMKAKVTGEKDIEAKKADTILDRFDLLSDSRQEVTSEVRGGYGQWADKVKAFWVEKQAESSVQRPVAIAVLMDYEIDIPGKGKVVVWDILDENLNWNEQEYGPENEAEMAKAIAKVRDAVDRVHGNYNRWNPIMAKKFTVGKLMLQFRTWALEGYANRFAKESAQGRDKGRYQSYKPLFRMMTDEGAEGRINTTIMPLFKLTKFMVQETAKRLVGSTFGIKSLRNRSDALSEFFGDNLSEIDARNMYSNIKELAFFTKLLVLSMMLTAALDGIDDDDDDSRHSTLRFMLNMLTRLETDISLYANPNEIQKLNKSFLPAMGVLQDIWDILGAAEKTIHGDWQLKSGINAGDPRLVKEILTSLPLTTQIYRFKSATTKLFDQ